MSQQTRSEVLLQLQRQYHRAGREYKRQLLTQAVKLLSYHRKAAIRALRDKPKPPVLPALILGRPREYHPDTLLPILKPIWFPDACPLPSPSGLRQNRITLDTLFTWPYGQIYEAKTGSPPSDQ